MKTIGIIDHGTRDYNEYSLNGALGGSETWVVELAAEFARKGYKVIVFNGKNQINHIDTIFGIEWIRMQDFNDYCKNNKFDYIIISRIYEKLITQIEYTKCCNNVYIMCHDWGCGYYMRHNHDFMYKSINNTPELQSKILKKFIVLSKWHKECLHKLMDVPYDMIELIPNGININDFNNINFENKDNTILWSSCYERGAHMLCYNILPKLRKNIIDAKVNICSYNNINNPENKNNGIFYIGNLSKKDLYKEMSKHKVWFYPCIFQETFCITAIEMVLCGNLPVSPFRHGLATTFEPYKYFFMKNNFITRGLHCIELSNILGENKQSNDNLAIDESVNMITNYMKNYNSYKDLIMSMQNYIRENYTWTNTANKFENLFKQN